MEKIILLAVTNNNKQSPTFQQRAKMGERSQKVVKYLWNKGIDPNHLLIGGLTTASGAAIVSYANPNIIATPDSAKLGLIGGIASVLGAMYAMTRTKKSTKEQSPLMSSHAQLQANNKPRRSIVKEIVDEIGKEKDRIWVEEILNKKEVPFELDEDGLYILKSALIVLPKSDEVNIDFDKLFKYVKEVRGSVILERCKKLTSLGKLQHVYGYLAVGKTPIKKLGDLRVVEKFVNITETKLKKEDFDSVIVKDKIVTNWLIDEREYKC